MSDLKTVLDRIEKWLEDAPTHPQVQYAMSYGCPNPIIGGENQEYVTGIHPVIVETWDKEAMISEWKHIRDRIEKAIEIETSFLNSHRS